jgi:hypothetical protein
MNKIERFVAYALFLMVLLWAPASLFAQSPFDGTWRTNMDQSKLSPKPYVFSVNGGMYDCSSCSPKINVKADGQDQTVTGQSYDTVSVHKVDSKSIAVTTKKNGKTVSDTTRTVSDDGNTLTVNVTSYPENSNQTVNAKATYTRLEKPPAGAHPTSGSWRINKVQQSDSGLTTTFTSSGDELNMSTPTGVSYTAKLDGKDYPVKGSYFYNSVSLKRVNANTIAETEKRDGKVVETAKMTVAPDGKKMTVVVTDTMTGRISTYVDEKQ